MKEGPYINLADYRCHLWGFIKFGNNKYATIGSVEQLLMISADPGIFGVCCNVWPDPN